jgi:hypothetical protein
VRLHRCTQREENKKKDYKKTIYRWNFMNKSCKINLYITARRCAMAKNAAGKAKEE